MINEKELKILSGIVDAIPQWYLEPQTGPSSFSLEIADGRLAKIFNANPNGNSKNLGKIRDFISENFTKWVDSSPEAPTPGFMRGLRESLALTWLTIFSSSVMWDKLFAYLDEITDRTHENEAVSLNIIITDAVGNVDITLPHLQKILDSLASSQQVYIKVSPDMRFIDYCEVHWDEAKVTQDYKFTPDFLEPYRWALNENDFSVHVNRRHDVVVMNKYGPIAAKRKGKWSIYDYVSLKNAFVYAFGGLENYRVGCNVVDVLLDLSYRRHGALMVFDPDHAVLPNIVNKESIIAPGTNCADEVREMLRQRIGSIAMSEKSYKERKKRLLLEVAGIDGAVVFDKENILAVGAMINPHPDVGSETGARTTAAKSAFLWGGTPAKVSADGDMTIFFKVGRSKSPRSDSALIKFL